MGSSEETDTLLDTRVALLVMSQQPGQEAIPAYSRDIAAAWQVKERIQHLPYTGLAERGRVLAIALAFDDALAQTRLIDLTEEQAADFICHAALLAMQEGAGCEQA